MKLKNFSFKRLLRNILTFFSNPANVILVVFAILLYILYKKKQQHGIVIGSYMILYSVGRFFIEGLRTDSLMFFGLRIAQIVSLLGILFGIVIIIFAFKKSVKK